jgi:tetratricopeptide (TPR) repeat protein
MTIRSFLLSLVAFLPGITVLGQTPAQAPPDPQPIAPTQVSAKDETPAAGQSGSVQETIRLAIQALDQAEHLRKEQDDVAQLQAVFEQVTRHVESLQEQEPANPWLLYLRGRAYALTGRPGDAVEQLRQFVETRDGRNEWRAYRLLGDLFAGEFPRLAKSNYQKAAALRADEPTVLVGLSACTFKLGDLDEAIRLAREAVRADGRTAARYLSHLASLLLAGGRLEEARREAEAALDLVNQRMKDNPGRKTPVLEAEAQHKQLMEILQALISDSKHEDVQDYGKLVKCARQQAQIARILSFHDVLAITQAGVDKTAPNTPPALLEQHGVALAEVGRTDEAVAVFEQLLQANPNNTTASEWLQRLRSEPAP